MSALPFDDLDSSLLDLQPRMTEVISDAPRLASGVLALEDDRRDLLAQIDAYVRERPDEGIAHLLTERLTDYRRRSAELLYQAYEVDLGGET